MLSGGEGDGRFAPGPKSPQAVELRTDSADSLAPYSARSCSIVTDGSCSIAGAAPDFKAGSPMTYPGWIVATFEVWLS
jgi:hypothetical protein